MQKTMTFYSVSCDNWLDKLADLLTNDDIYTIAYSISKRYSFCDVKSVHPSCDRLAEATGDYIDPSAKKVLFLDRFSFPSLKYDDNIHLFMFNEKRNMIFCEAIFELESNGNDDFRLITLNLL